jgi:hypothetical protein
MDDEEIHDVRERVGTTTPSGSDGVIEPPEPAPSERWGERP